MDNIATTILNTVTRYYNILYNIGYTDPKFTNRLLLLEYLNDFLDTYIGYVDIELYQKIEKILDCMEGCCIMPYNRYTKILPKAKFTYRGHQRQAEQSTQIKLNEDAVSRVTEH